MCKEVVTGWGGSLCEEKFSWSCAVGNEEDFLLKILTSLITIKISLGTQKSLF